jgi:hypothetical protein
VGRSLLDSSTSSLDFSPFFSKDGIFFIVFRIVGFRFIGSLLFHGEAVAINDIIFYILKKYVEIYLN